MPDGDRHLYITRKEFASALTVIWLYIMLVLGDILRLEWRWTTAILWGAALIMMLASAFASFKAGSSRTSKPFTGSPPSDRVKEIARDPDRKIDAIKAYRDETGAGLAEAKQAVEAYIETL